MVVDTVGAASVRSLRRLLARDGRLALIAAGLPQMLAGPWIRLTSRQRLLVGPADESPGDLRDLVAWHAAGEYRAVIDRELPLEGGAEAHALVDSGRKRGAVVLRPTG